MNTITTDATIKLPPWAVCPKCGAEVVIEDIDEYEQNDDGTWQVSESGLHINCITEPDIDSAGWEDWHRWHWDMPYVYWLPLEMRVWEWMCQNYRFDLEKQGA